MTRGEWSDLRRGQNGGRMGATTPEMNLIEDIEVACPHCGESFAIEADTEAGSYTTIEDCAVCCRPMAISIQCRPGEVQSVDVQPG